jgi:hypothetical protein
MSQPEKPRGNAQPLDASRVINPFTGAIPQPKRGEAGLPDTPPPVFGMTAAVQPAKLSPWRRILWRFSMAFGVGAVAAGGLTAPPPQPAISQSVDTDFDSILRHLLQQAMNWSITRCCSELGQAVWQARDELEFLAPLMHRVMLRDSAETEPGKDNDAPDKMTELGRLAAQEISDKIRPTICGNQKIVSGTAKSLAEKIANDARSALFAHATSYALAMVIACTAVMIAKQGLEKFCKGEPIETADGKDA